MTGPAQRFNVKWLTAALLLVAALLGGLLAYRSFAPQSLVGGTALDTPLRVPALRLVSDRAQSTTLAASDGRVRLVFFGFVHCPDVCPATLASLKGTYDALTSEQRAKVQVQLVSVDPVVDTPALLREYLDKFDASFTGLTGQPATIDEAARALFVSNIAPRPADHGAHTGAAGATDHSDDNVSAPAAARIHGDEVRVITPQGDFVRVYDNQETIDGTLQRDLPALIAQYGG
ncbi:SCO family protein [Deinococcus sp. Leaf326]|uniref:SCO family protein n=1 Tax=Deinococcus sp. Leaf326 TaxID=1736338 RepID=UPI0006F5AE6D|nr:SCO family protein [Deinococcus sp. Leaf326]KQR41234.1 electron transporter [Deinococcus sp. Leaf326]